MRLQKLSPFILFALFTFFIQRNLFFENFNIDEIILYFSSLGIPFHDLTSPSLAHAPLKDFTKILFVNSHGGSMDPGGFNFVIFMWNSLGELFGIKSAFFLRLLPFSFFLISFLLYSLFLKSFRIAPLVGALLLYLIWQDQIFFDYLFTVRPYIMEVCAVLTLCALLYFKLLEPKEEKSAHFILLGIPLAFFASSRYTVWPIILLALLYLFWLYQKEKRVLRPLCVFIPSLLIMAIFSFTSLRLQIHYHLPYMERQFLGGYGFWPTVKQLMNPMVFAFLSYPVFHFFFNQEATSKQRSYSLFLLFFMVVTLLLDLFNLSPFAMDQRFTLFFHAVALLNFSLLISPVLESGFSRWSIQSLLAVFIPGFLSLYFFSFQKIYFRQASDLLPITSHLSTILSPKDHIYCDQDTWGMIHFHKAVLKSSKVPQCKPLENLSSNQPQGQKNYILKRTGTLVAGKVILGGTYEQLLLKE